MLKTRFPGRRFSYGRLVIAVCVVAVFVVAGYVVWRPLTTKPESRVSWAGGYVDLTATPSNRFESTRSSTLRNVVLAFVVAKNAKSAPCTPSWGGYYTLAEARSVLDLDRRIARLNQLGHEAVLSFGGATGPELAQSCTNTSALAAAYQEAVSRYKINTLDFDLEGSAVTDAAGRSRRVAAVARLQKAAPSSQPLRVWLTLPASASGLTVEGLTVVREFLAGDVRLAGVNLMTMNFGTTLAAKHDGAELAETALAAAHGQLQSLYRDVGRRLSSTESWHRLGATPMIGQNETTDEVFTLKDAARLNDFARAHKLGRLSMWSLNRDDGCGDNYPDWTIVATFCSGVNQQPGAFATQLFKGFTGSAVNAAPHSALPTAGASPSDNPSTSPYPIWSSVASYPAGTKVVWRHNVYEAKWWTQGQPPDQTPTSGTPSPWTLIGPVLPGEGPISRPRLPAGFYHEWSKQKTYHRGDRVMLDGVAYAAKWWTRGDSPDESLVEPGASPWERLTDAQVQRLLAAAST